MCPECISTATMVTARVSSAGGVGAFVISKLRRRKLTNAEAIAEPSTASFEEWIAGCCCRARRGEKDPGAIPAA